MPFKLILHRKVIKEIRKLPEPIHSRVIEALKEMETDPFRYDVKPLQGAVSIYRRRVGDYRIVFHVDFKQNIVFVSLVEHRSAAYKTF